LKTEIHGQKDKSINNLEKKKGEKEKERKRIRKKAYEMWEDKSKTRLIKDETECIDKIARGIAAELKKRIRSLFE